MTRMSLRAITRGTVPQPPRIVVYGEHGIGKTTFGASAPSPIVLPTEDGLGALPVPTFPQALSYADVIEALGTLFSESHTFQTLVVDSLDWLEPLVWAHTCAVGNKSSIEEFGYGKGYVEAAKHWGAILDGLNALRAKGMAVICLAHAEVKRFDSPTTEPFDRYQPKLHARASHLLQEWADVVGFAHYETFTTSTETGFNKKVRRGVGQGRRLLAVESRPAWNAKNRYSLPATLPLAWPDLAAGIGAAYAAEPEPVAATA